MKKLLISASAIALLAAAPALAEAVSKLEGWAAAMQRADTPGVLGRLLDQLSRTNEATAETAALMK